MLNCYIIDDESHAIELLTDYIGQTPGLSLAGSSSLPVEALHQVLEQRPDLLFLDIDMPLLSGLEFYQLVNGKVQVVFITAHAHYAVESYTLNAADFLLKPIRYERFVQCIQRLSQKKAAEGRSSPESNFIYVQSGLKAKIIKIAFDDIVYIESLNNYVTIHLSSEKHIVYLSLKEMLERLPADRFSRIHKSYIINDGKIKTIEGNRVFLGDHLPAFTIGTQFKENFFDKIETHLLRKVRN